MSRPSTPWSAHWPRATSPSSSSGLPKPLAPIACVLDGETAVATVNSGATPGKLAGVRGAARMLAVLATALLPAVAWDHDDAAANRSAGWRSHVIRDRSRLAGGPRASASIVGGRFARAGQFPWLARVLA